MLRLRGISDPPRSGSPCWLWLPLGAGLVAAMSMLCISSAAAGDSRVSLPGTGYQVVVGESQLDPSGSPSDALTAAIADWLSREFALPPADRPPLVNLVSSDAMTAVRFGALGAKPQVANLHADTARADLGHEFFALYDGRTRTIYLAEDWTGAEPRVVSIFVHEMVHHLQNAAGITYACPAEREKLAYKAQARFLGLFGQSLESAFSIDPMTLLVRTTCAM